MLDPDHTGIRSLYGSTFCGPQVIGTIRCECLDYLIPMSGRHLRCGTRINSSTLHVSDSGQVIEAWQ